MADNPYMAAATAVDPNPYMAAARVTPATSAAAAIETNPYMAAARIPAKKTSPVAKARALDAFAPILKGAARTVGTGVGKVFDIVDRPRQATQAALAGKNGLDVFFHGESPEQSDANRATLRDKIGLPTAAERAQTFTLPNGFRVPVGKIRGGVDDFALDTVTDPLLIGGTTGAIEKGINAAGRTAFPAVARGAATLQRRGGNAGAFAEAAANVFDAFNYKGASKRALAAKNGADGLDQFAGLKTINNARERRGSGLGDSLVSEFRDLTKGLSDGDRDALYEAVHTGHEAELPAKLQPFAQRFSALTDSLAHLSGTRGLRKDLAAGGFTLPEYAQRFDTQIRSLQRPTQYRKNYVPTAHELDTPLGLESRPASIAELDARITGDVKNTRTLLEARNAAKTESKRSTTRGLKAEDPSLKERGDHAQLLDAAMQDKVIEARLRSGAKAISARDAEREVGRLFGVGGFAKAPAAAKAFFQESYRDPNARDFWSQLAKASRATIDLPKQALFALPFRHMANIGTLSIFADPSLANVFGTAGRFARIIAADVKKDPVAREGALGKAGRYGVTGTPSIDRSVGWTGRIPLIGDLYKTSNHVLWAFDDAAKAQRFEKLRRAFQSDGIAESAAAHRAAVQVGAELIDYSNRSPFTQALAYIAPFATYHSKLPGAIARTAIRHPERIATAGRLSPELVGDEQDAPNGLAGKSYVPLAETLRGVEDPWGYARSIVGSPARAIATAIGVHGDTELGGYSRYFNYGKPIDTKFLVNSTVGTFPGASALIDKFGLSEFPDQGISGFVRGQTGFGLTARPSPFALVAKQHAEAIQRAIDAARSSGNDGLTQALEQNLASYRRYHHL